MSKELIEKILSQNSNSQDSVSKCISEASTKKINKQELVKQGYAIFEHFELSNCLVSLYFVDGAFSANINSYNRSTIVEKEKIRKMFEDKTGYSIEFSL